MQKKICSELRTIENLLNTALEPVGKTLYVVGGGWFKNKDESGNIKTCGSTKIGLHPAWEEFYNSQDENYKWDDWNFQTQKGLDCFLNKVTEICESIFEIKDKNKIKDLKACVTEFDKLCDETKELSPDESKSLKEIYNHILKKVDQWNLIDDKKLLEVHSLFKSIKCDSIVVLEDEYKRFYNAFNKWCRLCLNEKYTINQMDILKKGDYQLISNSLKKLNKESKKYKNEEIDDKKFATEFLSFITDFKEKILSKFKNEEEQKANPPIHRVATIIKNYETRLGEIIKQN